MMEDVVQLRLNDRQELFDYDKPDFIPQNIASIEMPTKNKQLHNTSLDFPHNHTVTNPYNYK